MTAVIRSLGPESFRGRYGSVDKSKVGQQAARLVKRRCGHRVTMDRFYIALLFARLP